MEGLKISWFELDKVWNLISGMSDTRLAYANPSKMRKAV